MSSWSFNLYVDRVMREVRARTLGRFAQLVSDGEEIREVSHLLFENDTVLVAYCKKKLKMLMEELGRLCRGSKLKVNVAKSNFMQSVRESVVGEINIVLRDGWPSVGGGGSF